MPFVSEFVIIAEAGILEEQSLLLCESIRRLGGKYSALAIKILQPRPERKVSDSARARFAALNAEIIELAIVSPCPEYGTSYRVFACAEYERLSQADVLIFLDSDTLFLAEPDLELNGQDIAFRPVDVKGMCTAGPEDPFDPYWRDLCRVCEVNYDRLPEVVSTVDQVRVKASYNGGLTVVKRSRGFFGKTAEFFERSLAAGLVPWPQRTEPFPAGHGMVSVEGGKLWGSSQACLSLAATALDLSIRILPASVNFPLHSYHDLSAEIAAGSLPVLTLVHYHHLFSGEPGKNPILSGKAGFPPGSARWLRGRINAGKHLVLVLGMHRSGTSALTKNLEIFGTELGSNFNPATADNPTGFWEDKSFHALNEEILKHLHRSWDDLQLLESSALAATFQEYLPRALAVLDAFLHQKSLAGLKDPRFSLLLPFWKKVFAEAGIQISFVIGFRNPLSVAASLYRRDGFPKLKAIWLWVLHNVRIAAGIPSIPSLVIDYDKMLEDPRGQAKRLGHFLGLSPDPAALETFCADFLKPGLRHSHDSFADLQKDADCDPIVLEIYQFYSARSAEAVPSSSLHWEQAAVHWEQTLRPFRNLLHLSSVLWEEQNGLKAQAALREIEFHQQLKSEEAGHAWLIQKQEELTQQNAEFIRNQGELTRQNSELTQKHGDLTRQNIELAQKHGDLAQQNAELIRNQGELARQNAELTRNQGELARQNAELTRNQSESLQKINELTGQNADLIQKNSALVQRLAELDGQIRRIKKSFSWKVTAPLRYLANLKTRRKKTSPAP